MYKSLWYQDMSQVVGIEMYCVSILLMWNPSFAEVCDFTDQQHVYITGTN